MSRNWTFESICRAARRKTTAWRVGHVDDEESWTNTDDAVKCARGYCPLGIVFGWRKRKRPDTEWLQEHGAGVSEEVAEMVMQAADNAKDENRPRMLKLLGIKVRAGAGPSPHTQEPK